MSYSGTAVLALIIGSLIWMPLNYLVLYKSHYIDSVIERKGDPLELMLRRAMGEGKPLRFNLKNDKVYVGFVTSNFNPIFQSEYLKILPIVSGNTDQTAAKAMCGKDYRPIYAQMHGSAKREAESGESRKKSYEDLFQHIERVVSLRDLEVLIPITELQSVECLQVNRTDSSGIDASIGPQ
jgi:hypothetical protein